MLIKTVVDETFEGAKTYESYCSAGEYQDIKLNIAEIEYDEAFVESFSKKIEDYYIHTIYNHDYESSSDAGDGRDDCYTEEEDLDISINECIIKDNEFFGVMCESFGLKAFALVDFPLTKIFHPDNYEGTNYHFYRSKEFNLIKK